MKNKVVDVIDLSHLESELKEPLYGLIGHNQLSYFTFHIDYTNRQLNLWRTFHKQNHIIKKEISFILHNHIPIIEIDIAGKKLKLGLDTGAGVNTFDSKHKLILKDNITIKNNSKLKGADKHE